MTVYVDDMYTVPMGRFRRMKMSHMIADTEKELHAMAKRIGLRRSWFQGDHYDVSLSCRKLAVVAGAREISMKQCAFMAMNRRFGYPMGTPETAEKIAQKRMADAARRRKR